MLPVGCCIAKKLDDVTVSEVVDHMAECLRSGGAQFSKLENRLGRNALGEL